jgi:predicted permease
MLLVGAGLFVSSFVRLLRRDLGFDPASLLMVQVSASRPGLIGGRPTAGRRVPDFMPLVARVAAIPGVEASGALASTTPLSNGSRTTPVTVNWRPEPFADQDEMMVHEATSGILAAMRLEHLRGRWIEDRDTVSAPLVVLLNDEAAHRYFPGREALGAVVSFDDYARTVVGIVADTQSKGPEARPTPEAWVPLGQHSYQTSADLVIRTRLDVGSLMPEIRRAVSETLPGAVVQEPKTFDGLFMEFLAQRRFNALLVGVFGALALVMVSVGIYGVMACVVDQRTREIGVRMALGAKPAQVLQMMLGRAAWLAGVGLAIGVLGAAGLERSIRSFLYEPTPHDPLVYAAVAALAIAVTLIAAFVPARRAASVDPLVALRRD